MVIIANRSDVDEELDRLEAHLIEIRRVLKKQDSIGRRLDFLMQELNREANTLGSKSIAGVTTNASVELKVLIEQMREQIQNIEQQKFSSAPNLGSPSPNTHDQPCILNM